MKSRLNAFARFSKCRALKKKSVKLGVGEKKVEDGGNYNN